MENDLVTLFLQGFASGLALYVIVWFIAYGISKVIAVFTTLSK